jgi:hypothetical protein
LEGKTLEKTAKVGIYECENLLEAYLNGKNEGNSLTQ